MSASINPQQAPPIAATPSAEPVAAVAPATLAGFSVSVGTVGWLAIIGIVAALRLARLEHLPLTIDESVRALAAWQTAHGHVPDNWSGDLSQAVTAYLFAAFGDGDQLARLAPALLGCLTVALCWPLTRCASAPGGLLAAVLLALSPLLISVSRSGLPYAAGAALSMGMIVALFAFLRSRSPVSLFAIALTAGLALGSDAIATSTTIVLLVFLALEATTFRSPAVSQALTEMRRSRPLVLSALFVFLAAIELGVTRFGTKVDTFDLWKLNLPELSLPGLRLWTNMFGLPRDHLPWLFHPGLLISYEAPILILGTVGFLWVLYRWIKGGTESVPLLQRFLVIWAGIAAIIIASVTQREAGQLVMLVLPLALLAGCWLETLVSDLNLVSLVRSLPFVAPVLFVVFYLVLVVTRWARDGNVGRSSGPIDEPTTVILAAGAAVALLWLAWSSLGRRAVTGYVALGTLVSFVFLMHGATSVAYGRGSEFLADERVDRQVPRLEKQLSAMGGPEGTVAADKSLLPALGWYLRDVPGLVFTASPPVGANAYLAVSGQPAPSGYQVDRTWPIAQGWVPETIDGLDWWQWLVYRESYGSPTSTEADLLVKAQ